MPATASFDVFDTLLVRPVADPHDVFRLVERDLAAPGWCRARISAERQARALKPSLEVNLDEIYAAPALNRWRERGQDFRAAELQWEAQIRIDPAAAARVAAARNEGATILYITDTYLPRDFILERLNPVRQPCDTLLMSHEEDDSKGRTWWASLSQRYAHPWHHVGNHPHSDVAAPRRHGISAELWTHSVETPVEGALRRENSSRPLAAGLARLARLTRPADAHPLWDDGANISGPLFYGFVRWVLATAAANGAGCVYFLSRDGQLPSRIAALVRSREPGQPETRYLCGSRHAWYLALFDPANWRHRQWVWLAPQPTIRGVLANLEIDPTELAASLLRTGHPAETWDRPFSRWERRHVLEDLARDPVAVAFFAARRAARLRNALAYFEQEGVFAHERVVLVDIGWSGSMLRAFQELIAQRQGKKPEAFGCFLGLHQNPGSDRFSYMSHPTVWPHWLTAFPSVVEMLAPGDHGQTIGYLPAVDGTVQPAFAEHLEASPAALVALHAGALRYTELALAAGEPPPCCARALRTWIVHSTAAQRARWSAFRFWTWQNPATGAPLPLFRPFSNLTLLRRLVTTRRDVAAWPWPTATLLATWPRAPRICCSALVLKFQLERMARSLLYAQLTRLRALARWMLGRKRT